MSYNIIIGEPHTYLVNQDINEERTEALEWSNDNAPAFGMPFDYVNECELSYSSWDSFFNITKLNTVFYVDGSKEMKGSHPGYIEITEDIFNKINDIYKKYKNKYPNATPTFKSDFLVDKHLAKFEWLMWWINYSIKNNEVTIISNS